MSTNDRVFHTALGEMATQPHPMGELVVGDRFVGPDETTVYEVTGDCASNNGSLYTRNLSMSADQAAVLAQADGDPRDGVFIYPPSTPLHRVQLPRRWTTEIDGVLRGPAMTQPQAEDAWAKLAAEGYDVTVVDLDHQHDHAEDDAGYDVAGDAPGDSATADPRRPQSAQPWANRDEPTVPGVDDELGRIRAAADRLPNPFTDADLAAVGITSEQLDRVVDADRDAEFEAWHEDRRVEIDEYVHEMSEQDARQTIEQYQAIHEHTASCNQDAGHCETCSALIDNDPVPETAVEAARIRLTHEGDYPLAEHADPATTDPWRPASAEPYQHSAGNSASAGQQLMEETWAAEYGGPWDDLRADAAHREVEHGPVAEPCAEPTRADLDGPDRNVCDGTAPGPALDPARDRAVEAVLAGRDPLYPDGMSLDAAKGALAVARGRHLGTRADAPAVRARVAAAEHVIARHEHAMTELREAAAAAVSPGAVRAAELGGLEVDEFLRLPASQAAELLRAASQELAVERWATGQGRTTQQGRTTGQGRMADAETSEPTADPWRAPAAAAWTGATGPGVTTDAMPAATEPQTPVLPSARENGAGQRVGQSRVEVSRGEDVDITTCTDRALDRAEATCRRIDEVLAAEHDRAADQARAAELSRRHAADRERADRELSGREATDTRAAEVS